MWGKIVCRLGFHAFYTVARAGTCTYRFRCRRPDCDHTHVAVH